MPNPSTRFRTGQRYVSRNEPDLGLGVVTGLDGRFVEVTFRGAATTRRYGCSNAPLQRVVFKAGDTVADRQGARHLVSGVSGDELLTYHGDSGELAEADLGDSVGLGGPFERLLAGIVDPGEGFDRRLFLLESLARLRSSPLRGFIGARIQLLPHQLCIAQTVAARRLSRVLLCDETGLGKTIEAALIVHRLLLCGRVERALVVVPEALVHQWFVELLRRFNLAPRLFSPGYCDGCPRDANPFAGDALGIVSLGYLESDERRARQAIDAGWDLVVVDEAHHCTPASRGYELVAALAPEPAGLLLLTATPEQLGREGHFSRLQLLDPLRYREWSAYEQECQRLRRIGEYCEQWCREHGCAIGNLDPGSVVLSYEPRLNEVLGCPPQTRGTLTLEELIDLYGIGRALFRSTRDGVGGFPGRRVAIDLVEAEGESCGLIDTECREEWGLRSSAGGGSISRTDPRLCWLAALLGRYAREKFLVICTTREKAAAIQTLLGTMVRVDAVLFHEEMSIVARDRAAAWFGEPAGARVLVCSENGSEGRNFQFCHHLVLFDLPFEPEVLEQRIGRLDRIGQATAVSIHVPCVRHTAAEVLCRWYHEGLNALACSVNAAGRVHERLHERLRSVALGARGEEDVAALIDETRSLCERISSELAQGRDRLLEIATYRRRRGEQLARAIADARDDPLVRTVFDLLCDEYGLVHDEAGEGRERLITEYVTDPAFPLPREEQAVVTFRASVAVEREEVLFLSADHPMITGGLDLFLSSDRGRSSFVLWEDETAKELLLESCFVVYGLAPRRLHPDRFLPPTPVRIVVDHTGTGCTARFANGFPPAALTNAPVRRLQANRTITTVVAPAMLRASQECAQEEARRMGERACRVMGRELDAELARLCQLEAGDSTGVAAERSLLLRERDELEKGLREPQVRLDSLRLIWHGKPPSREV